MSPTVFRRQEKKHTLSLARRFSLDETTEEEFRTGTTR
jgi:hypothetical protein